MSSVKGVMLSPLSALKPADYLAWWLRESKDIDLIHYFAITADADTTNVEELAELLRDADFVIYLLGHDIGELSGSLQQSVRVGPQRFFCVVPSSLRGVTLQGVSVLYYDEQATDDAIAVSAAGVSIRAAIRRLGHRGAPTLFISYRREDTLEVARTLYNSLARVYGAHRIFIDLETAPLGGDFEQDVQGQILNCSAVIVLIGHRWLAARDHSGRRRLDNPNDFVRSEVGTALTRNVLVMPVLVNGALLPRRADLPSDLQPLVDLPAVSIDLKSWQEDVEPLLRELDRFIDREAH